MANALTIKIDRKHDEMTNDPRGVIADKLRELASAIANGVDLGAGIIRDANGNTIGQVTLRV